MPCFLAAFWSSMAPFMTPWSVRPRAGCPNSAALAASASILHAPSRSEYSEWTWRCAQPGVLTGSRRLGGGSDGARVFRLAIRGRCGLLRGHSACRVEPRQQHVDDPPVADDRGPLPLRGRLAGDERHEGGGADDHGRGEVAGLGRRLGEDLERGAVA